MKSSKELNRWAMRFYKEFKFNEAKLSEYFRNPKEYKNNKQGYCIGSTMYSLIRSFFYDTNALYNLKSFNFIELFELPLYSGYHSNYSYVYEERRIRYVMMCVCYLYFFNKYYKEESWVLIQEFDSVFKRATGVNYEIKNKLAEVYYKLYNQITF